ncbi:MAG: hypothetical protein EOO08_08700 [Chitinophagaceae bacterium]|nr:MAG: hypothetical protein EOO08_08700 [Chitinophagaceae bacterium]
MKRFASCLLVGLLSILAARAQRWQIPANGKRITFSNLQTKLLVTYLAAPRSYNTKQYYENGRIMADENWRDSLHHGVGRYYLPDGTLSKEINFDRNYITSYVAYVNGAVYTKISADRSEVIHQGRRLNLAFDRYYEVDFEGYVQVFTRKQVIDFLSIVMMPEEVTQLMADKFDAAMKNLPAGSDLLGCSNGTSRFDDHGADLASFNASSGSKTSRPTTGFGVAGGAGQMQIGKLLNDAMGQCAGAGRAGGVTGAGGVRPRYSAEEQRAREQTQTMIANCRAQSSTDRKNKMIGVEGRDVETGINYAAGITSATIRFGRLAGQFMVERGAAQVAATLAEGGTPIMGTIVEVAGESVAAAAAAPAAQVIAAGAAGYSLGTLINKAFLGKIIQNSDAMAAATTSDFEAEQTRLAAEAQKKKEAQDAAAKKAGGGQSATPPANTPPPASTPAPENSQGTTPSVPDPGTSNTPPASAPGVKMPSPEANDPCQSMQNFFNRCESSGWKEFKCAEYVRLLNNCKGDLTVINPTPDGSELAAVGCGASGNSAAVRALDCKKKGMIQITSPDGKAGCGHGQPVLDRGMLPDRHGNATDPARNPMGAMLQNKGVAQVNAATLQTRLASARPLLVIFYDPQCSFCNNHLTAILAPENSAALKGVDVVAVDVTENPSLATQYGVSVVPTTYRSSGGKLARKAEGAMNSNDLRTYLQ